MHCFHLLRNCL